jgi:hypothetical protein
VQSFIYRCVGDDVGEAVQHIGAGAATALLAVDPYAHGQRLGIGNLVRGDQPRTHDIPGVEILALRGPQHGWHFPILLIARADIVENAVAENMGRSTVSSDILTRAIQEHAELEFIVQPLAISRPHDVHARANHAEAVRFVVHRDLLEHGTQYARHVGRLLAEHQIFVGSRLQQMLFKCQAIIHLQGYRHGRKQADGVERPHRQGPVEEGPRLPQRRRTTLDERLHVAEMARVAGRGKVRYRGLPGQQGTDVGTGLRRKCNEFHYNVPSAGVHVPAENEIAGLDPIPHGPRPDGRMGAHEQNVAGGDDPVSRSLCGSRTGTRDASVPHQIP